MSRKGISPPRRPPMLPCKMKARLVIGSLRVPQTSNLESGTRESDAPRGSGRSGIVQGIKRRRTARESPDAGVDSLKKLPPKSREFARPDSLPDAPHGVKEERKVVVREQDRGQHLARHVEVADVGAGVAAADGAAAGLVERSGVRGPARVLDVEAAP